jgi:ribosome biogenesis protein BMS1
MSDIVFLRTWYPVTVNKYYNPVTDLLRERGHEWQGMKTVYQLRKEKGLQVDQNPNSEYKPIERKKFIAKTVHVPSKMQAQLPYNMYNKKIVENPEVESYKRKYDVAVKKDKLDVQREKVMDDLKFLQGYREQKVAATAAKKLVEHQRVIAKQTEIREQRSKENRKQIFRLEGMIKQDREKKMERGKSGEPAKKKRKKF